MDDEAEAAGAVLKERREAEAKGEEVREEVERVRDDTEQASRDEEAVAGRDRRTRAGARRRSGVMLDMMGCSVIPLALYDNRSQTVRVRRARWRQVVQ